jgi:hypothetical protein
VRDNSACLLQLSMAWPSSQRLVHTAHSTIKIVDVLTHFSALLWFSLQHMPRLRLAENKERAVASATAAVDADADDEHVGLAKELSQVLAWQVSLS